MKKSLFYSISFLIVILPLCAAAERCGRYACLEFADYGTRGHKEIKIRNKTSATLACFIRYENDVFTEIVTSVSTSYYLEPHYQTSWVSYRCDIQDQGCHPLLVKRGLCKST